LNNGSNTIGIVIVASIKDENPLITIFLINVIHRSNNNAPPPLVIALSTSATAATGRVFCHPRSESEVPGTTRR
jgi:hypothetical protein